jgi:hypothetical protein
MRVLTICFVGLSVSLLTAGSAPAAPSEAVDVEPHRAVYDITLTTARPGSGIGNLTGRMVYEVTGNRCEGWTQSMRFVTRLANSEGATILSDLRSSTWEDGKGSQFRFSSTHNRNVKDSEQTEGDAKRAGTAAGSEGPVTVTLAKPEAQTLTLAPGTHFPMQHTLALLAAARRGDSLHRSDLYDGSDKGAKVFATSAVIGPRQTGMAGRLPAVRNGERLSGLAAWPMAVAYFEKDKTEKTDAVPDYELSFVAFENGVSSKLDIDYGDFAVRGTLVEVTFLPAAACPPATR